MKGPCVLRSCCFGVSLDDGIHGIVVWDSLYALFIITSTLNTMVYYAQTGQESLSFSDSATAILLVVRAIIGMTTCCKNF